MHAFHLLLGACRGEGASSALLVFSSLLVYQSTVGHHQPWLGMYVPTINYGSYPWFAGKTVLKDRRVSQ